MRVILLTATPDNDAHTRTLPFSVSWQTRPFFSTSYSLSGACPQDYSSDLLCTMTSSLTIVAVGKTGCGKSTLINDLIDPNAEEKPEVGSGKDPVTQSSQVYSVLVEDVAVNVCDTRGLFDAVGGDHEEITVELVREICSNSRNGVVLVCIEMHGRADASTAESLALLHKRCGVAVWRSAVIVLTKANKYPKANWLESKKWRESSTTVFRREFEKCLSDNKEFIQRLFTAKVDVREECRIGLTKEEFEALQIPILPVARRKDDKRMKKVGCSSWFDDLLLECVKREKHCATLLKIHKHSSQLPMTKS